MTPLKQQKKKNAACACNNKKQDIYIVIIIVVVNSNYSYPYWCKHAFRMTVITICPGCEQPLNSEKQVLSSKHCADLRDEELGESLRKSSFLTRQDHLEHVTMKFFHHHKHLLWRLKHAFEIHYTQVSQALKEDERTR